MSQRSRITRSTLWGLPILNLVFGLGLCIIHAHAETVDPAAEGDAMGAWDRIASGPLHWSAMDKVLFFALVMLALEILKFLCYNSGGTKEILVAPESLLFSFQSTASTNNLVFV